MAGRVSLLTLNLGLLEAWPAQPWSHAGARTRAAPALLQACGAEVIVLQEVFWPGHRRALRAGLRGSHPYACSPGPRQSLLGCGLMVLSRHPIRRARFHRHRRAGGVVFERGALTLEVAAPGGVVLPLLVVHLEPGVAEGPAGAQRVRETAFMLELAAAMGRPVLAGDFNCSPEVSPEAYRQIVSAGFLDAHLSAGGEEAPTWDAANPLNRAGRHRDHPSQRIDHVFVPEGPGVRPVGSRIVLQEAAVRGPCGGMVPVSDHYGLLVELLVPC